MNNTRMTKQAYIRGLAARGILRAMVMQKKAENEGEEQKKEPYYLLPSDFDSLSKSDQNKIMNTLYLNRDPDFQKSFPNKYLNSPLARDSGLAQYAISGGIGAGAGAAIGALIQAARKKNILAGLGIGAGIGGGLGLGGKLLNDSYIYPKIQKKNLVNPDDLSLEEQAARWNELPKREVSSNDEELTYPELK